MIRRPQRRSSACKRRSLSTQPPLCHFMNSIENEPAITQKEVQRTLYLTLICTIFAVPYFHVLLIVDQIKARCLFQLSYAFEIWSLLSRNASKPCIFSSASASTVAEFYSPVFLIVSDRLEDWTSQCLRTPTKRMLTSTVSIRMEQESVARMVETEITASTTLGSAFRCQART